LEFNKIIEYVMQKWEYQIVYSKCERKKEGWAGLGAFKPSETLETEINRLGSEGWEMVSFVPSSNETSLSIGHGEVSSFLCVFKRVMT
jgi:hypothetical protein